MRKIAIVGAVLCCTAGWALTSAQAPVPRAPCLHERGELPSERARRQQAIQFAALINRAEMFLGGPSGRARYRPFEELTTVPAVPNGFRLQFHTNGTSYSFSLKDERDPCGYSIFSDQESLIYEAMPRREGGLVPATDDPQP
jgi:hypothetical protein